MTQKWLSIVGIGEDGLAGLSLAARSLVDRAEVLVGGDRHLNMLPNDDPRLKLRWGSPIDTTITEIQQYRGQAVCVLASGDPLWYGIGVTLARQIPIAEITIIPVPSTFSLACARLGWALAEVETLSLCGRPPALLSSYVYPNAKLLILSADNQTPTIVADLLIQQGYGLSSMMVLEHLGGLQERLVTGTAHQWRIADIADLNTIAIHCTPHPDTSIRSRTPGLPDSAYHHDGQLTKREVRAITLAALAPNPGELLWDIGAGCGSISIEWLRSHPRCRAVAIEKSRTAYIADNAIALGVPHLQIVAGTAPTALQDLPSPNAIFIGGGATAPGLWDVCWSSLKPGGRLVANVVTIAGEQMLWQWHQIVGGTFTRIAIQRAEPIGAFLGWRSLATITQWVAIKS